MVLRLAKHNPKCIYLGTRCLERGEAALSDIKSEASDSNAKLLEIHMVSFASIESAVAVVKADFERLDTTKPESQTFPLMSQKTVMGYNSGRITWVTPF
ncbi:hypothetical protein VC83_01499 [Pseudogymnoascus destructans]|uniref:Uncharacterized protein n=2 Tax=Pseudogymnoascus destructans TaxID=655981 RepID=L8FZ75_PSED2|nr:uncharacterized protein VC83_01499 [Pseudogymnoascus destructans]ELR06132.1 hypothetical protein GMDG_02006 [Pseudogymnoascus destructans 20631-21]OAF62071.2 hypothetical protein VC83_01499 [Pseudogymnoascus destructans]